MISFGLFWQRRLEGCGPAFEVGFQACELFGQHGIDRRGPVPFQLNSAIYSTCTLLTGSAPWMTRFSREKLERHQVFIPVGR